MHWNHAAGVLVLATAAILPSRADLTIMPLGDSLTWGYDGNPAHAVVSNSGGYRSPLYTDLNNAGIASTYVGVNTENADSVLTGADNTAHNGYNGYRIDEINGNLANSVAADSASNLGGYWLTGGGTTGRGAESANIILLQIGANDIEQGYDPAYTSASPESLQLFAADETARLKTLIDNVLSLEPGALLLVDGTTPLYSGSVATQRATAYDADVASLISQDYQGKSVRYVDMYDAFVNAPGFGYYQNDGVHLNTAGYAFMGSVWEKAILADYDFSAADAVPEPSTWSLMAALAGFGLLVRRVKSKSRLLRHNP